MLEPEQADRPGTRQQPFLLLTQDDCPQCLHLHALLARPLRGQFDPLIRVVHRQQDPEVFSRLAEQYGVQSTPALLRLETGQQLRPPFGLGPVHRFLTAL